MLLDKAFAEIIATKALTWQLFHIMIFFFLNLELHKITSSFKNWHLINLNSYKAKVIPKKN